MPFPNDRTYNFDVNLQFSDNAAPYTATGYLQAGGANGIIDLGGNQGTSPKQQPRIDAVAILDVTSLVVTAGCSYKAMVLVSNDPAFGPGNVEMAAEISLGVAASRDGINMLTTPTGRQELMFTTNIAGNIYEYAAVYLVVAGAGASINIEGFFAVLPEM